MYYVYTPIVDGCTEISTLGLTMHFRGWVVASSDRKYSRRILGGFRPFHGWVNTLIPLNMAMEFVDLPVTHGDFSIIQHDKVLVDQRVSIIYPRKSHETPNEYHKFYALIMLDRKCHF